MSLTGNGEYYMSWQLMNTLELTTTFLLFSIVYAALIFYLETMKSTFLRTFLLFSLIFIPFLFCFIHLVRQFLGAGRVESIIEIVISTNILGLNIAVLCCAMILLCVVLLRKTLFGRLKKK